MSLASGSTIPLLRVGKKTFTVTRPGVSSYVNGLLVQAAPTVFTIEGNIQPLTASELTWMNKQDPTEAAQSREMFKLYSPTQLLALDETAGTRGDIVTYNGKQYEVQRVFLYEMDVLNHSKMIIVKFPDQ